VFRPEETRHNGLNDAADAEETEEAVLTEAGNHATTESGEEDTDDETYVPENNPVIESRVTKSNDTSLRWRVGLSKYQPAPQLLQSVNQETNNTRLGQTALDTENDNNNALVPESPATASAGSTSNVPAASIRVEIANGSSPTTQVATKQAEEKRQGRKRQAALDSPGDNLRKKRRETRRANDNGSKRTYGQKMNIRLAGTRREGGDLVDATVANVGATTASPVTA